MNDLARIETEARETASKEGVIAGSELDRAKAFQVVNQDTLDECGGWIKKVKSRAKLLEEQRKHQKEPILEAGHRVDEMFKPVIEQYTKTWRILKNSADVYLTEQEKIRQEAERKERVKAEKERKRKEELARKATEKGNYERAEEHRRAATEIATPVIEKEVEKPKGLVFREIWNAEVTDTEELILAVANQINARRVGADMAGKALIPTDVLVADMKVLNKLASSMKDMFNIPGVRAVSRRV